jgi:hypothetical protein
MNIKRLFTLCFLVAAAFIFQSDYMSAKKPEVTCDKVKKGIGYYPFFFKNIPLSAGLDENSLSAVESMFLSAFSEQMKTFKAPVKDLKSSPFSFKDIEMVRVKAGGMYYEFLNKKLFKYVYRDSIDYVIFCVLYTQSEGAQDRSSREFKAIDFKGEETSFKAYNFIVLKSFIYGPDSEKPLAKTKEQVYLYKEWFARRHPEFSRKNLKELFEVDKFKSADQYRMFMKDSVKKHLMSFEQIKVFRTCKQKGP